MKISINGNEYNMPLSESYDEQFKITEKVKNLDGEKNYDETYRLYNFIANYITICEPGDFKNEELAKELMAIKQKLATVGGAVKFMHERGKDDVSINVMVSLLELMLAFNDKAKNEEQRIGGK